MQKFSALLVLLIFGSDLTAAHLPGGSITYKSLGDSFYEINLTLFRECGGAVMIPQELYFSSTCGISFTRSDMIPNEVIEVSQLCSFALNSSNCNGGALSGYLQYSYIDSIYLSPCANWTISWDICCRSASVNVANTPGIYMEAKLNNLLAQNNSSSFFTQQSLPNVCVNEATIYDAGAMDDLAFRRTFSLVDARYYGGTPALVEYLFPNYGGEPVLGMTIDPDNGQISFTPTEIGSIVTVIQVDEYNSDDVWIGSVQRDLPFRVVACTTAPPDPGSGMLTTNSSGVQLTGDRSFSVCMNSDFCLNATISDPTTDESLTVTSSLDLLLPNATIVATGTNSVVITICGNSGTLTPGNYTFTLSASDNACPIPGYQVYSYSFTVLPNNDPQCNSIGVVELVPSKLSVYPNPITGDVVINGLPDHSSPMHLDLIDLQGRIITNGNITSTGDATRYALDRSIVNGTYTLRIIDNVRKRNYYSRIVIAR